MLDVIHAAFTQGWIDAAGTDVAHRDLAEEGIISVPAGTELPPTEPEGPALLALMLPLRKNKRRHFERALGSHRPGISND